MELKKYFLKNFIANQLTSEGLDELQRTVLCAYLGHPMANDGPKGSGKTETVRQTSRILGMDNKLHTKVCGPDTQESHIIAGLSFEQDADGTKRLFYQDRVLTRAAKEGGIAYLDEVNLLENDLQKRLNSLIDDRRFIEKPDGERVNANDGFWFVCSYNPTKGMFDEDLDESVSDRLIHIPYTSINPNVLSTISYNKAKSLMEKQVPWTNKMPKIEFPVELDKRGILFLSDEPITNSITCQNHRMYFVNVQLDRNSGSVHCTNFFNNSDMVEYIDDTLTHGRLYIYHSLINDELNIAAPMELDNYEKMISLFSNSIKELKETGKSLIINQLENTNKSTVEMLKKQDYNSLMLHVPTSRIQTMAMMQLYLLHEMGASLNIAEHYATRLVIDQICHGSYRHHRLTNMTVEQLVKTFASLLRLFGEIPSLNVDKPKELKTSADDKKSTAIAKSILHEGISKTSYFDKESLSSLGIEEFE